MIILFAIVLLASSVASLLVACGTSDGNTFEFACHAALFLFLAGVLVLAMRG